MQQQVRVSHQAHSLQFDTTPPFLADQATHYTHIHKYSLVEGVSSPTGLQKT